MPKSKHKRVPKTVLKLPDLEQSRSAVVSLTSPAPNAPTNMPFASSSTGPARNRVFTKAVVTRYRIALVAVTGKIGDYTHAEL